MRVSAVMGSEAVASAYRIPVKHRLNHATDEPPGAAAFIAEKSGQSSSWMRVRRHKKLPRAVEPPPTAGAVVDERATGRTDEDDRERQRYEAEKSKSQIITR